MGPFRLFAQVAVQIFKLSAVTATLHASCRAHSLFRDLPVAKLGYVSLTCWKFGPLRRNGVVIVVQFVLTVSDVRRQAYLLFERYRNHVGSRVGLDDTRYGVIC